MKNTGRQATIICSKPTTFATWSRKDYKLTIGQEDRRKLKENVKMMRKFRMFSNNNLIRDSVLEKVLLYLKPISFIRSQKIYKEDSETDGLYLIIEGNFEISQTVIRENIKTENKVARKALSRNKSDLHRDGLKNIINR